MDNNSNNNHKTIEMTELSDEEVQVFRVDELNFSQDNENKEENILSKKQLNKIRKVKNTNTKTKKKIKSRTKTKSKKEKDKKPKKTKHKKKTKEKQSKRNIAFILVILVLIAGGLFASWKLYFSFQKYNPFDYVHIVEVGADTQAYLEIEKDDIVLGEKESIIRDVIEFSIPKNESLSSGDEREINIILDKESEKVLKDRKIKLVPTSITYTVGNVVDLERIEVMDSLEIDYQVEGDKVRIDTIVPRVSDLDLRDLLIFETSDKLLSPDDNFTVTIKETKSLDDYLLEHGYVIDEMEREFTVEAFKYIPEKLSNLGDIDSMQEDALLSLESNLNVDEVLYEDFVVKQVCYTNSAENNENARDKNYGHDYSKGSLMFIVEFKQIDEEDGEVYADVIGYTNIVMTEDSIDGNQILEMNPLYENASIDMVKTDMIQNSFTCSRY